MAQGTKTGERRWPQKKLSCVEGDVAGLRDGYQHHLCNSVLSDQGSRWWVQLDLDAILAQQRPCVMCYALFICTVLGLDQKLHGLGARKMHACPGHCGLDLDSFHIAWHDDLFLRCTRRLRREYRLFFSPFSACKCTQYLGRYSCPTLQVSLVNRSPGSGQQLHQNQEPHCVRCQSRHSLYPMQEIPIG